MILLWLLLRRGRLARLEDRLAAVERALQAGVGGKLERDPA